MITENDKIAIGVSGGKDSLTPVSYTHLDVYKRQIYSHVNYSVTKIMNFIEKNILYYLTRAIASGPVSYTHLDVYKRQGIFSTV